MRCFLSRLTYAVVKVLAELRHLAVLSPASSQPLHRSKAIMGMVRGWFLVFMPLGHAFSVLGFPLSLPTFDRQDVLDGG